MHGRNTNRKGRCRQRRHAGRKGRVQTGRDGVHTRRGFTRMPELVVDLDELDLRQFFKARYQWTRDVIQSAVRLAAPRKVNVNSTVSKLHFPVAGKTVTDHGETPVPFHVARTLEELIQDGMYNVLRSGDKPLHGDLVRQLTGDQSLIICEVKRDFHVHRCAGG